MFSFCRNLGTVGAMSDSTKTEYDKLFIGGKWTEPSTSAMLLDVPGESIASSSVDPLSPSILMLRRPCCFQFPDELDNGKLAMNHSNKGGTLSAESDKRNAC